jgi:hypothetical protein
MTRHRLPTEGLYTGGAVTIPFRPVHNYAQQLLMHQQSKSQALSQYYSKLENNINPVGVRQQDMEGWQKKLQDWQAFAVQNRQGLLNPNADGGKAIRQFGAMHQDLLGDIQKSKAAAANERAVQPLFLDPKKRSLTTNKDLEYAHRLGLSIYDPKHFKDDGVTPIAPSDFSFNAPPFDVNKQRATNVELTRGLKQEKTYGKGRVNTAELKDYVPFTLQHSKQNLKVIGDRMASLYGNGDQGDKSIQQYYDNFPVDEATHAKLDEYYKSVYPDDKEGIGTDSKKLAMAHAIMLNSQATTGTEIKGWSRPPQPRQASKADIAQAEMMSWINGMTQAVKKGDEAEMNRYGDLLYAGKGTSKYQGLEQGAISTGNPTGMSLPENIKPGVSIIHQDMQYNQAKGIYEPTTNRDFLDPNDPALTDKLGRIYQMHMGSSAPMKSALLKANVNQAAPPSTKPAAKNQDDPLGLGIFKP